MNVLGVVGALVATLLVVVSPAQASAATSAAGTFTPVSPTRILDTRVGIGPIAARSNISLEVTGTAGVPSSGVSAVVLNVTVTNPRGGGYLTVYPDGGATPNVSNLNFTAGQTVPNSVTVPVSAGGAVALFNGSWAGSTDAIVDISGYYAAGTPTTPGGFGAVAPTRILDSRNGTGGRSSPIAARSSIALEVTGTAGVPSSGVSAVVLNVTVTNPRGGGYLTVYPDGGATPNVSNLNFTAGQTVPNAVIVPVSAGGYVDFFNGSYNGSTDVIADISGYFLAGAPNSAGAFGAVTPTRILDSRVGTGGYANPVEARNGIRLKVTGAGGVPSGDVSAVVLNVTVTNPRGGGYLTVYPDGGAPPNVSNLNFTAGQTVPNSVIVPVSAGGYVDLFNGSWTGSTDVIADISGYYLSSDLPASSPGGSAVASGPVTVAGGGQVSLGDGSSVTIPAGAVTADTTLTLSRAGQPPAPVDGALPAGNPVHITLASGELTGTATVTVPAAPPAGWPGGLAFAPLLAYYDDTTQAWIAENATWDPTSGLLTAQVNHFSWWNPFTWDYTAIGDSIKQALSDMAGVPSGIKPDCPTPPPTTQVVITGTGASLLDYCLDSSGSTVTLKARAKPDFPLMVSWSGSASLAARTEYGLDVSSAFRWLASQSGVDPAQSTMLPTGGEVQLTVAPDANAPVLVNVDYEPRLQLIGVVDATVRVILALRSALNIGTTAAQIASAVVDTGCFVQHLDDLARDPAGAFTTLVLDCSKDAVEALTAHAGGIVRTIGWTAAAIGSLLGVIGYAANQPVSLFYAGKALLSGQQTQQLTIAAAGSPTTPPPGSASPWPTGDDEGPPILYTWFGASLEIPDWVSCSYAGAWCIAGIQDTVHIMRVNGLADVGSVPLATRDPVTALVGKGFTVTIAQELVHPGCPAGATC